ncbi:MAG: hypothetical protein LBE82_12885 [Chitinophagaceae bacterium]|jgi:hypothetical protein|nr:hypothetical protein [Chitinophagaceae bacterium]
MNNRNLYILIAGVLLLQGCVRNAYYVSPFNAANNTYHPMLLKSDSAKTVLYATASYIGGSANDANRDQVSMGNIGLSGSTHFGSFQTYYGASLALGSYSVGTFDTTLYGWENFSPKEINSKAGNKFFGGGVFSGGINYVLSFDRLEWRVAGVEAAVAQEFGQPFRG